MFCNLFKCKTGVYSIFLHLRFAVSTPQGGAGFREYYFLIPLFCFCVALPPTKCSENFERRLGQEQTSE